jgi:hypothetical protein
VVAIVVAAVVAAAVAAAAAVVVAVVVAVVLVAAAAVVVVLVVLIGVAFAFAALPWKNCHCKNTCVFVKNKTLPKSRCCIWKNVYKNIVKIKEIRSNIIKKTWSTIVKQHCQTSPKNMVDDHQKTW